MDVIFEERPRREAEGGESEGPSTVSRANGEGQEDGEVQGIENGHRVEPVTGPAIFRREVYPRRKPRQGEGTDLGLEHVGHWPPLCCRRL